MNALRACFTGTSWEAKNLWRFRQCMFDKASYVSNIRLNSQAHVAYPEFDKFTMIHNGGELITNALKWTYGAVIGYDVRFHMPEGYHLNMMSPPLTIHFDTMKFISYVSWLLRIDISNKSLEKAIWFVYKYFRADIGEDPSFIVPLIDVVMKQMLHEPPNIYECADLVDIIPDEITWDDAYFLFYYFGAVAACLEDGLTSSFGYNDRNDYELISTTFPHQNCGFVKDMYPSPLSGLNRFLPMIEPFTLKNIDGNVNAAAAIAIVERITGVKIRLPNIPYTLLDILVYAHDVCSETNESATMVIEEIRRIVSRYITLIEPLVNDGLLDLYEAWEYCLNPDTHKLFADS